MVSRERAGEAVTFDASESADAAPVLRHNASFSFGFKVAEVPQAETCMNVRQGITRLLRSRTFHQRVRVARATPWDGGHGSARCGDKLQHDMYQLSTTRYGACVFAYITSDRMWMNRLGLGDSWR